MWLYKPVYESLPYFYLLAGTVFIAAGWYLNFWYWPTICFALGVACVIAGVVLFLRRRDFRKTKSVDTDDVLN